jgi:hypothetical protein
MTRGSVLPKPQPHSFVVNINAFSITIRILFVVIVSAMVIGELTSVPMWPPLIFYPYCAIKLLGFVAIGILTPIAFWRFNALNRGLLYAALSAAFVETMQAIVNRGHSGHAFHWYELVVKLVLILFGFSIGLDIRYESQITIGPIQFLLHGHNEPRT